MLVQQYFAATIPNWEEIYQRRTLYSTIYQQRLWTALRLVERLHLPAGSTALDIGCGPGFGTTALARRGFSVDAVDALDQMVDLTLARARAEGVSASVRGGVSDIRALPFPEATFDLVFVVGVTEWLDALAAPLAEVARVLKPDGHLVLSADNSWALSCILDPLQNPMVVPIKRALGAAARRLWPARRKLRTRAYSIRALDVALRRAGLTRTSGLTLGFGPFSFFNQTIIPDHLGHLLHRRLQALAGRDTFLLRAAGLVHLVTATPSTERTVDGRFAVARHPMARRLRPNG